MEQSKVIGIGVAAAAVVFVGAKMIANSVARDKLDSAIADLGPAFDVRYDDVSVGLLGFDVHVEDLEIATPFTGETLRIDEIILHDFDNESDVPTFLAVSIEDAEMPTAMLRSQVPGAGQLGRLGYDDYVEVDIEIDYEFDKRDGQMRINRLSFNAEDIGEIEMQLTLEDVRPETLMFSYAGAAISFARISYEDDSLVERVLEMVADQNRTDVDDMVDDLVRSAEEEAENTENDFLADALEEIADFIDDPDEISLEANPDKPVSIGQIIQMVTGTMRQQEKLAEALQLEVDA